MRAPARAAAGIALITIALCLVSKSAVTQQSVPGDPARSQIRQTLRAFYFNLAHGDWEALTADILAAKVVAHRSPPAGMLPRETVATPCAGRKGPQIDQAAIALSAGWAEVLVPRCAAAVARADEFLMIKFEQRWRFVAIHLSQEPLNFSSGP